MSSRFDVDVEDFELTDLTNDLFATSTELSEGEVVNGSVQSVSDSAIVIRWGSITEDNLMADGEDTVSAGGDFFGIIFADLRLLGVGDLIEVRHG